MGKEQKVRVMYLDMCMLIILVFEISNFRSFCPNIITDKSFCLNYYIHLNDRGTSHMYTVKTIQPVRRKL